MKKFPQTTMPIGVMISDEAVLQLMGQLQVVIESKYTNYLKIVPRQSGHVILYKIYFNTHRCSSVCLRTKTAESVAVFDKVKSMVQRIISHNPMFALAYADDVIKGPWPPGEAVIATTGKTAFTYAADVIKGPWPPGEKAISTSGITARLYAREVIEGPWPPGEAAIAQDAHVAYLYASETIKGPWPPGEATIKNNPYIANHYEDNVLKPAGADWSI